VAPWELLVARATSIMLVVAAAMAILGMGWSLNQFILNVLASY
jgi:hypothetical protein